MKRLNANYQIYIDNVSQNFDVNGYPVKALKNISLFIEKDEIVSIVGPSGCGKTTILNLIAGFIEPTEGEILIDGNSLQYMNRKFGMVFQQDASFPWLTVAQNIGYGANNTNGGNNKEKKSIADYIELVGLKDFADRYPRELSGGMRKRVELGRTYASDPEILLLDEPFGSLDVLSKQEMQSLLLKIWENERKAVIFVTHDVEEAIFLSNRVLVMTSRPGAIKEEFWVPFEMSRERNLKLTQPFLELRRKIVASLEGNLEDVCINQGNDRL